MFDLPKARKTFFNLCKATKNDILHLVEVIETINDRPMFRKEGVLQAVYGLSFKQKVSLDEMAPEIVTAVLCYHAGDFERAHDTLKSYLQEVLGPDDYQKKPTYAKDQFCLLDFLSLLNGGEPLQNISKILITEYEKSTIDSIDGLLNSREAISEFLDIPQCGVCEECKYRKICHFESWQDLNNKVQTIIEQNPYNSIKRIQHYVV